MNETMQSAKETQEDYGVTYKPDRPVSVIKKDGTKEPFNVQKVIVAIQKSAYRALTKFTDEEKQYICQTVVDRVNEMGEKQIPIQIMHNIVESALEDIKPVVAKSYRDYRNYKQDFVRMMDDVYKKSQAIMYVGDKENSNTDSALVATKRSLTLNQLNKELYQKFFMTTEELQACREGYIYVHDMSARRDTMNCFSRSTRFITNKGVKSFMDFNDGDTVTVPSHKGIYRQAIVHKYGQQSMQVVSFELRNTSKDTIIREKGFKVTPNHRWLLKDGTETTSIKVGDELIDIPEMAEHICKFDQTPNKNWRVSSIIPLYTIVPEEVWCLDVEVDHSFLLEDGIPTGNCSLFDVKSVLSGGFEMGNIWYNEPKTLDVAFDVIGDITLSAASQQYGGFTLPELDKVLEPYAEKSYKKYVDKYLSVGATREKAEETAWEDVRKDFEQGFQGLEYKFNTVGSSRGDYPFITVTAGLATSRFGKMAAITMLDVRRKGQGRKGNKKPVLFPKIVFLYDENLHGPGKELEDVFEAGVLCSSKTMYPDWLSLTGKGYVPSMYKKYNTVISPMGCRAHLSPWYERGGMKPADENDKPVFVGRFNIGAVSLHLPMILAKSRQEGRDFYEVLDYYLNLIRNLHIRTYAYLGEMRASTNPLGYCEGGFYGGHLGFHDKIKPLLKPMTASFGVTALNELQMLYNKKSLVQDGAFALEVMEYINKKVNEFKEEDGNLYAIYGTPAESLCSLQVKQFREKYGIIEGVSDREYVSNSFHCHVTEDITPIEKQDLEYRFWNLFNGGKIQYVKYPIDYNLDAIRTLIRRAMDMGLYEGVNLSLAYCDDCGHQELEMDTCPKCGSRNLTKIDRMNGYLSYSRVHGDTRLNAGKMAEIAERKSM